MKSDGTYVGRAAPEIDIIEAIVEGGEGHASLSAQWAPFNVRSLHSLGLSSFTHIDWGPQADYRTPNGTGFIEVDDPEVTVINPYRGGIFQQTTSGLAVTNQTCYELSGGCFTVYGFEYKPGCVFESVDDECYSLTRFMPQIRQCLHLLD
jgi:hypothetical protein